MHLSSGNRLPAASEAIAEGIFKGTRPLLSTENTLDVASDMETQSTYYAPDSIQKN